MTQDVKSQVELLKQLKADHEFGTVVNLTDIQDALGTTKLITHAEKGMYYQYADVKAYGGENDTRKSFYIYFRNSKFKKFSMSLTELRNCTVKVGRKELAFIPFLEERVRDKKTFPLGMVVTATSKTEESKKAWPLAYYEGYTKELWQAHRKKGLASKQSSETIRAEFVKDRAVTEKFKAFPFLASVQFQVVE